MTIFCAHTTCLTFSKQLWVIAELPYLSAVLLATMKL